MGKKRPVQMIEWRTKDSARLKSFYGGVFHWKFDEVDPGHYTMVDTGNDELAGGIFQLENNPIPASVVPYISVDDLDESEKQIAALGGRVVESKHEVPGWGAFSIFLDPDGSALAIWQNLPKEARKAAKREKKEAKRAAKKERKDKKGQKDKNGKKNKNGKKDKKGAKK